MPFFVNKHTLFVMKTVLITGGSEGIGFAFAKDYASKGYRILLNARNMERLSEAKQVLERTFSADVTIYPLDLSEKGSAKKLFEQIQKDGYMVDCLINNAGVGYAGYSQDIDLEKDEALVQLNCASSMTLTKLYLREMTERNAGEIINVCSTGAFVPGPYIASYYASKAFLLSYTEALAKEKEDTNIRIRALCPGPVDTAFYEKSNGHKPKHCASPEEVVRAYKKAGNRQVVIIPGLVSFLASKAPKRLAMMYLKKEKGKYL